MASVDRVNRSLSPVARIVGTSNSAFLRPLLQQGFARRRRALDLVGGAIGRRAAPRTHVQQATLGGVPVDIITPPGRDDTASIVYLHGGAYVALSTRSYRRLITHLAVATRSRVVAVDYRLAPEHPYPAALEDAVAAYTAEAADNPHQQLILAGDSAGGGLTMKTAVALRDRGHRMPAALVCIAPWVDLTCSGESMVTCAPRERVLSPAGLAIDARAYAGTTDLSSPLVSPLFADLSGLPPMLIQVGADEILLDDSTRLAAAAREAGVPVDLEVWPRLWHDWHLYAGLMPEANAALKVIADFVNRTVNAS